LQTLTTMMETMGLAGPRFVEDSLTWSSQTLGEHYQDHEEACLISVGIESLSGKSLALDVKSSLQVSALVEEVACRWYVSPAELQLIYRGKPLSLSASLAESGIGHGSRLQTSMRTFVGGCVSCKSVKLKARASEADEMEEEWEMEEEMLSTPKRINKQRREKHRVREAIQLHRQESRHTFQNCERQQVEDADDEQIQLKIHYSKNWAQQAKIAVLHFMQDHEITPEEYDFELQDRHGKVFDLSKQAAPGLRIAELFPLVFIFHNKIKRRESRRSCDSAAPIVKRVILPPCIFITQKALTDRHPSLEHALGSFAHQPWKREIRAHRDALSEDEASPCKRER
jgi:hypothetical protein